MNKWIKYSVAGLALTVSQMALTQENNTSSADAPEMETNVDVELLTGGSKLKDRMLHEGGPAVEFVRVFPKSTILKDIES